MSDAISAGKISHVAVDFGGEFLLPADKLSALCDLFDGMVPVSYSWQNSGYQLREPRNPPVFKLLTVTDVAKVMLSDPA